MAKICTSLYEIHVLTRWKCVLRCCANCPSLVITFEELNGADKTMCPTIIFNVYKLVHRCAVNGRRPHKEKNI